MKRVALEFCRFLRRPPVAGSFFLAAAFVVFGVKWPSTGESDLRFRLLAMTYQLVGASTVCLDLTCTAKSFGLESILRSFWRRLTGKHNFVGQAVGIKAGAFGSIRSSAIQPMDPMAPVPDRLRALEANIGHLREEVKEVSAAIGATESRLTKEIDTRSRENQNEIRATAQRLREVAVGSYEVLIFGAAWVVIGTIIGGVAPELGKIFGTKNVETPPSCTCKPSQ
jgi:hypothetical protein